VAFGIRKGHPRALCCPCLGACLYLIVSTDPDSWPTTLDASLHLTLLGAPTAPRIRRSSIGLPALAVTIKLYELERPLQWLPQRPRLLLFFRPRTVAASSTLVACPTRPPPARLLRPAARLLPRSQDRRSLLPHLLPRSCVPACSCTLTSPLNSHRRFTSPSILPRECKACQDSAVTALLDNTTSAAFGHQTLLALMEGPGGPTHRPLQARTRPGRRRALSAAENGNSATHYRF
jgi:hypothetical protein